jgi:hypothetical protein
VRLTGLVAKHAVQNVTSVAASQEEHVDHFFSGSLVTEEGNSRSIPNGVEVARVQSVNRGQHD